MDDVPFSIPPPRRRRRSKSWQDDRERVIESTRAKRAELIEQLGGKCVKCGATDDLHFHHTSPRTWIASKLNRWARLAAYKRDIEAGVIELLCGPCNRREGQPASEPEGDPDF